MSAKTLGTTSAQLLTALAESNRTVFSITDAQEILGKGYDATVQILRRLTRTGWLVRLTAGRYAIVPLSSGNQATPQINRYIVARDILEETPYYISHESAMDIHNMLTRPVTRVIVTTPRRLNNREILNIPYHFVYAPRTMIWGCEPNWVTPYDQVNVSDLERTILDGLSRSNLCAGVGQVAVGLWIRQDDFSWEKMGFYAGKLDHRAAAQRLGFLLELYGLGTSALLVELQALISKSYALLDPLLPDEGTYLSRWRLRLNLETETLRTIVNH